MQFSLDWVTKAVTLPWYTVEEKNYPWLIESFDESTDFIPISDSFVTFLPLAYLKCFIPPHSKQGEQGWKKLRISSPFTVKKAELRTLDKFFLSGLYQSSQVLSSWNNDIKVILKSKIWVFFQRCRKDWLW